MVVHNLGSGMMVIEGEGEMESAILLALLLAALDDAAPVDLAQFIDERSETGPRIMPR